jgi:hypothetical protein
MRVSVDRRSPDYMPPELTMLIHVFCNGKFLPLCCAFDDVEGWADVVATNPTTGDVTLEGSGSDTHAQLHRLHGKITYRNHGRDDADKVQADRSC